MKNSLTPSEQANLYGSMSTRIRNKSKIITDNPKFFTSDVITDILSETMFFISTYIRRPTRFLYDDDSIKQVWARMCIYLLMVKWEEESGQQQTVTGGVTKEIKSGNTTVKYETSGGEAADKAVSPYKSLDDFKPMLNEYRRPI